MLLQKGMYADPNCQELGLQYGQIKHNAVVLNAGWFNDRGEKLGVGDLAMTDLVEICRQIPMGEIFFALTESECFAIPQTNRLDPGVDFVIKHATWAASTADIFKLDDNSTGQDIEDRDGVSYVKMGRTVATHLWLNPANKFNHLVKEVEKAKHFGLDVYHLSDESEWAIGDNDQVNAAALKAAYTCLWNTDPDILARFISLTDDDKAAIASMQESVDEQCNNLIAKMLADQTLVCCDYLVKENTRAHYLDFIEHEEVISDTIPGLPPGHFAYRIDG